MRKLITLLLAVIVSMLLYACSIVQADGEVSLYTVYGEVSSVSSEAVSIDLGKLKAETKGMLSSSHESTLSLEPNGEVLTLDVGTITSCLGKSVSEGDILQIIYTKASNGSENILSLSVASEETNPISTNQENAPKPYGEESGASASYQIH